MPPEQDPLPPLSDPKQRYDYTNRPVPAVRGWKKLLPFRLQRTNRGTRLRIAWKQAVVSLLLLVCLGWTSLAAGAYFFVKYRRGFPEVNFVHMLLYPIKKDAYRASRGDFLVAEGKNLLSDQKYREAFENFGSGLSLSPGNREGRLMLSQFYTTWQRPDRAERLLVEGLNYHAQDKDYLQTVFTFLLQRQSDFELIDITGDLLAQTTATPPVDDRLRLVVLARATALFYRGNYDEAEALLVKYDVQGSPDAQLLQIRIDWDRGERETALSKLAAISGQAPENEQIYAQYAAYLREIGRDGEMRRLALLRQIAHPDRPRPRIDLLYLYSKAGDEVSVNRGVDELFADFNDNAEALVALADFAANTGRPELARRIYEHCKERHLPWEGPALMTVEAHVVAKQYRQALAACDLLIKENPEWGKRFQSVFNGLQAIANFGMNDEEAANLFLGNFLNQAGVRAENLVAVSNRLISVGASRQARQVLAQAVKADPLNQGALTSLIRIDLEAGHADTVAAHLRTLMTMRKPPRDLLQSAYRKLGSDRFLFAPGRSELLNELRKTIGG
jgi:thioredoxin-like negative regulator of GroEL